MLATLARAALDVLLPPSCASCDAPVAAPGQLCAACFQTIAFISEPLCVRCGLPFASRQIAGPLRTCAACAASPPAWGRARAAMMYDAAAKRLILPFKHADREDNAATLALHMQRAGAALLAAADLLVPVPLHRSRLRRRRYNQAALLAAALAARTRILAVPDLLVRLHATQPLGMRGAAARAAALDGAIAMRPTRRDLVQGRHIVLVDDVLTSGATARACVHVLLDAGASAVDVLVAARVADPRSDRAQDTPEDDDADD